MNSKTMKSLGKSASDFIGMSINEFLQYLTSVSEDGLNAIELFARNNSDLAAAAKAKAYYSSNNIQLAPRANADSPKRIRVAQDDLTTLINKRIVLTGAISKITKEIKALRKTRAIESAERKLSDFATLCVELGLDKKKANALLKSRNKRN